MRQSKICDVPLLELEDFGPPNPEANARVFRPGVAFKTSGPIHSRIPPYAKCSAASAHASASS